MSISATRRTVLASAAAALFATSARADDFPSHPIRMLLGFGAGGGTDLIARLYVQKLQEVLKTPIVIENKPGASQLVAIRTMLAAQPDGYTLFMGTGSSLAQGPAVRKGLPYDPLKDFSFIGMVGTASGTYYVDPRTSIHSMADLIAYAKANPGKLNYGSAGVGSADHLQMEYVKQAVGINLVMVPYESDQDVAREVMSGHLPVGLSVTQVPISLIQSGDLRAIAISGKQRLPQLPNVPTLTETGIPGLDGGGDFSFYGLVGPTGMDPAVINKINAAINQVSAMPEIVKQMREGLVCEPVQGTPAEFRQHVEEEIGKWRTVGKSLNVPAWTN